jgi:hypothetical protein
MRADWLVNGAYVELFGLIGNALYNRKVENKRNLAAKTGIRLIEIELGQAENREFLFELFLKSRQAG